MINISPEINDRIIIWCNRLNLEPALIKSIIEQESHFNPYAIRYEPEWRYLLNPIHYAEMLKITAHVETIHQKISWGLGQLMGAVVRELGHEGDMDELFDPDTNLEYICKKIQHIQTQAKTIQEVFACYNGGFGVLLNKKDTFSNQGYVDSCMNHLVNWRKE